LFTHLGWVDMPHGHCLWSVSISGGGVVIVVVLLWGVASRALVILKIAVNVAQSDEPFTCHVSGLVVALLLVFIVMVIVGVGVIGGGGISVWVVGGQ